jgi:hypothetical protein
LSFLTSLCLVNQSLPGFEDEAFGAVLAVEAGFFFFEDAEGFTGEALAVDVLRVKDIAEFLLGKAVEYRVVGVKLGAKNGAAVFVIGVFIGYSS